MTLAKMYFENEIVKEEEWSEEVRLKESRNRYAMPEVTWHEQKTRVKN